MLLTIVCIYDGDVAVVRDDRSASLHVRILLPPMSILLSSCYTTLHSSSLITLIHDVDLFALVKHVLIHPPRRRGSEDVVVLMHGHHMILLLA